MPKSTTAKHPVRESSTASGRGVRITPTHVFFWGSILSNWHIGNPFLGSRALEHLVPEFDKLEIPHASSTAFSTRLISNHEFNCGEQFMMALKAWIFEPDSIGEVDDTKFLELKEQVDPQQASILQKILFQRNPKGHKALGRKIPNFNDGVWTKASIPVVVASQIARAEADPELKEMYLTSGIRSFVEGSPTDKIWGVGLKWSNPRIDNESNWRGGNRLGKCHDMARAEILLRDGDVDGEA